MSNEETIRQIAWISWQGAANAFRMYPDNKHTFVDYWDAAKSQFSEFVLPTPASEGVEGDAELFMYDTLSPEMVEVGSMGEALDYVKENFIDGYNMHPDFSSFDVFKKVGDIRLIEDELGNAVRIEAHPVITPPTTDKATETTAEARIATLEAEVERLRKRFQEIIAIPEEKVSNARPNIYLEGINSGIENCRDIATAALQINP